MSLVPFDVFDYLGIAREDVTEQFKDKTVFDKFLQLLLDANIELQYVYKDLMQLRSIDTATGAQLDLIGEIVGQERIALPGYLFDQPEPVIPDDDLYRVLIRSKIIRNNTTATPEKVIFGAEFILGVTGATIQEGSEASYILYIPKKLSKLEKYLINGVYNGFYTFTLIPKPAGVRVEIVEFVGENFFAFVGVPNAKGFGTYTGTVGYGVNYGVGYGASDFATTGGGIFANFMEALNA